MFNTIPKTTAFLSIAGLLALALAGQAHAGRDCGGLNQKSCWHVDPTKWCDGNLQYKPTGVPGKGTCVKREPKKACGGLNQSSCWHADPTKWCKGDLQYKPTGIPGQGTCVKREPKKACGGLNQSSCWHADPTKWCKGDLKYKPTGIPGQGTCIKRVTDNDLRSAAKPVFNKIDSLGRNNPLMDLRNCLSQPGTFANLRQQMLKRSENGINSILKQCNVTPSALQTYGQNATGRQSKTLFIELGAGAVAGVGVEGGIGYAIPLERNPDGRYYLTYGGGGGLGAAVGADVSVGLSNETMPTEHWANDKGKSVNFSGKAMGAVSVSVDFPDESATPSGFTISGGVGLGAEIGVIIATNDKYLYNF